MKASWWPLVRTLLRGNSSFCLEWGAQPGPLWSWTLKRKRALPNWASGVAAWTEARAQGLWQCRQGEFAEWLLVEREIPLGEC